MTKSAKFVVVYGRTDFFAEEGLQTLFLSSPEEVRKLAKKFIKVIPDDPEPYLDDINKWDATQNLVITHQDDDTFLFSCTPIALTTDLKDFHKFVKDFNAEP